MTKHYCLYNIKIFQRSVALAISAFFYQFPNIALAQEVPAGANPDAKSVFNNKMYRVEVNGIPESDIDRRRKSNSQVQVYGKDELNKFGDSNLAETLRRLPGVDVQGGELRLRGLGAGYAQILINGDPAPNGFSLEQLSPDQVERIEIAKAPTADQSGQSIAGSINIILKSVPKKRDIGVRIGAAYNTARVTPNLSGSYGDSIGSLAYIIPFSAFEGRGLNSLSVQRRAITDAGDFGHSLQLAEQPLWGHTFNASPQIKWRISTDETLSIQAFLQKSYWNSRVLFTNVDVSSSSLLEDPSLNHGSFGNQRYTTLWTKRLNDLQRIEVKLSLGRATEDFANQTYRNDLPYRISDGESRDRTILTSGKFEQLIGDTHTFSAGWEVESRRRDDDRSVTVQGAAQLPGIDGLPFNAKIGRQAYYVQDEWSVNERWVAYGGIRYERIKIDSGDEVGQTSNVSSSFAPLLHLTYKLDPKGKDLIRVSLTRSYKSPDLYSIIGRPSLNSLFPLPNQANNEIAPDRVGNPGLRPESATGLDIAYESYFGKSGVFSIGLFTRKITDLIRNVNALEAVSWASVPRWVTRPENFSKAKSSGLELELRGRAGEIFPLIFNAKTDLTLRAAANFYHSEVDAITKPDNRLDGQQPWSATMGFDYSMAKTPLAFGANFSFTPGYITQQTMSQLLVQSRSRALDFYARWSINKDTALKFSATNALPVSADRIVETDDGSSLHTIRTPRAGYSLTLDIKF